MSDLLREFIFSLWCHLSSACWGPASSEAFASSDASASSEDISKNIGIVAVVIAKLKLREIERQVRLADIVVRSEDSPFKQRPTIVNICRVDVATHVLMAAMVHRTVVVSHRGEMPVASVLIRRYEINLIAYRFLDEFRERCRVRILNHLTDYVSFATDRTEYGSFGRRSGFVDALAHVAISIFPAEIGFVDFNYAHQFAKVRVLHCGAEPMAQIPRRLIGTRPDLPMNLEGADALLAVKHRIENLKPRCQRIFSVLKNGTGQQSKAVTILCAFRALPTTRQLKRVDLFVSAARAADAIRPAAGKDVFAALFFRREGFHQLFQRHHMLQSYRSFGYVSSAR